MPVFFIALSSQITTQAQDSTDYYYQIPENPNEYTATTVAARFIDGLGFRYYWASEGLRSEDLAYRTTEEARSIRETVEHIYGLSLTFVDAITKEDNLGPGDVSELSYQELRSKTLKNIQRSGQLLKSAKTGDIDEYSIIFVRGDFRSEYPYWNMINGPIADAMYHTGQIVTLRRASGNPIKSGVNVLVGRYNPG